MALGPGKYDDFATVLLGAFAADAVLVMVLGGTNGSGFSVQMVDDVPPADVAKVLRAVADAMEKEAHG